MELSLPLALAEVCGQCDLVGITTVSSPSIVDGVPVVASSEIVTEFVGFRIINGLPKVVRIVVSHGAGLATTASAFTSMLLEAHVSDLYLSTCLTAAEVEHEVECSDVLTRHLALHEHILRVTLQRNDLVEVEVRIVSSVCELHSGAVQILISLQLDREVVGLVSRGRDTCEVLQLELSLPTLVRLIGQRHHKLLIAIVGIGHLLDIVAFPGVAMGIVTEQFPSSFLQHVARIVEVEGLFFGLVAASFTTLFIRLACTIVISVILQHHIRNLNHSFGLTATEVKHKVELVDVLTFHIALDEQILSITLQRNDLVEVEIRIVSSVCELHSGAVQILISLQFDREVVVLASLSGHTTEVLQLELSLPTLVGLMGQRYHKLLVAIVGVRDVLSIVAFPAIAMGIVAADLPRSVAQHIAVTIELIALEGLRSIVLLAGEHKAPGDTFALIEQNHLRVRQLRYREYGIGELCIAGKIGEERLFRQLQHYLITNDIKFVAGSLILYGSHEVNLTTILLH